MHDPPTRRPSIPYDGFFHLNQDNDFLERLVRMESKLDAALFRTDKVEKGIDEHDFRIRNLETAYSKTIGIAVGVSSAITLGAGVILKLITF